MRIIKIVLLPLILLNLLSCVVDFTKLDAGYYAVADDYPENTVPASAEQYYRGILSSATINGFPGYTVAIDGPGGFWAGAGGLADIANVVDMQKNNLFRIGSLTKPFTAALILDLEEDGLLSIDQKISRYLPEEMVSRIANAEEATILQLLNHTSGIPNYFGFSLFGLKYPAEHLNHYTEFSLSKEELVRFIYNFPADFPVGSDWNYSNTNYVLLAIIAETVTATDFSQLLEERIFTPLGLDQTYSDEKENLPKGLVRGYDAFYGDNLLYDVTEDSSGLVGDGGIISNTYDIIKFFRALFNLQLFSQTQLDKMLTQYPYNRWGEDPVNTSGYALGLFFETTGEAVDYYSHYGYVYGYGSDAYYFPQTDTIVVMLTNMTNNPKAGEKSSPLAELLWSFMEPE